MELSLPISDQKEQMKTFNTQVYSSSLLSTERSQDISLYPTYK